MKKCWLTFIRIISIILLAGLVLSGFYYPPVKAEQAYVDPPATVPQVPEGDYLNYFPLIFRDHPWDSLFGVEMTSELGYDQQVPPPAAANMSRAGATWVRRNGLFWSQVEPSPGQRNWPTQLENELINANKYQLRPILVVRSTPPWAQKYANNYCGPIASYALDDFANFMRDVVARYSKDPYNVMYYELWNEPDVEASIFSGDNLYGCWGDYRDRYFGGGYYAEMLKQAYPAIKAANPKAQVIVGGLLLDCDPNNIPPNKTDCNASKFLQGILENGGGNYFDGVGFHSYDYFGKPSDITDPNRALGNYSNTNWWSSWNTTGPTILAKSNFLRSVLAQYGYSHKYLMNTEVGLVCGDDYIQAWCEDPVYSISFQNTKAYYVVQAYVYARWLNFKTNVWFTYYGWRSTDLWSSVTEQPEAAYHAYDFVSQKINRSSAVNEITSYNNSYVKGYEFVRSNHRIWVLWYVGGDPANGSATTTINLPGTPTAIWRWVKVGSGTPNDGTYQLQVPDGSYSPTVNVGRGPLFIEFSP